jgi:hypothetical protein
VLSAGCLYWLQRLEPVFFALALGALSWQAWLVLRRPARQRTWGIKTIFATSAILNAALIGGWVVLAIRYR